MWILPERYRHWNADFTHTLSHSNNSTMIHWLRLMIMSSILYLRCARYLQAVQSNWTPSGYDCMGKNPHTNWFCNESVTVSLIEKIWNLFDYPQSIDFNGQHFTVVKSNYFRKKLRFILIEIQRCKFDFIFIRMKCVNFHTIQKGT